MHWTGAEHRVLALPEPPGERSPVDQVAERVAHVDLDDRNR